MPRREMRKQKRRRHLRSEMENWRELLPPNSATAVILKTLHEAEWLCASCRLPILAYAIGVRRDGRGAAGDNTVVQSLSFLNKCPRCSETVPFYPGVMSDDKAVDAGLIALFLARSNKSLVLGVNNMVPRIASYFIGFALFHIRHSITMRRGFTGSTGSLLELKQIKLCRACNAAIVTNMPEEQCLNCMCLSSLRTGRRTILYNMDVFDPAYCSQLATLAERHILRGTSMYVRYFHEGALC